MTAEHGRAVFPGSFDPLTVAHLSIADTVRDVYGVRQLDLVISRVALAKDPDRQTPLDDRLAAVRARTGDRPWLRVAVTDDQLLVDVADGYDLLVVGADKWLQLHDPSFYGGDPRARDDAISRLPDLAVVPRGDVVLPPHVHPLVVPIAEEHRHVSSTAVRDGRHEWRA